MPTGAVHYKRCHASQPPCCTEPKISSQFAAGCLELSSELGRAVHKKASPHPTPLGPAGRRGGGAAGGGRESFTLTPKKSFSSEPSSATTSQEAAFCQGRLMAASMTSLSVVRLPGLSSRLLADIPSWRLLASGAGSGLLAPGPVVLLLLLLLLLNVAKMPDGRRHGRRAGWLQKPPCCGPRCRPTCRSPTIGS